MQAQAARGYTNRAMVTKKTKPRRTTPARRRPARREPYLWEKLAELGKSIPPEELARIPTDGARNLHHYLHGAPKPAQRNAGI